MYDTINGARVLECTQGFLGCSGVCWQDSFASEQYDTNRDDEEDVAGWR